MKKYPNINKYLNRTPRGEGTANLMKIADDIDRERTGKPAFYVVPLCCLKD